MNESTSIDEAAALWIYDTFGSKQKALESLHHVKDVVVNIEADAKGQWTFAPSGAVTEAHTMVATTLTTRFNAFPKEERLVILSHLKAFTSLEIQPLVIAFTNHTKQAGKRKETGLPPFSPGPLAKKPKLAHAAQQSESTTAQEVVAPASPTTFFGFDTLAPLVTAQEVVAPASPTTFVGFDTLAPLVTAQEVVAPAWLFTEHEIDSEGVQAPSQHFLNGGAGGYVYLIDPETLRVVKDERYPMHLVLSLRQELGQFVGGLLPQTKQALSMVGSFLDAVAAGGTAIPPAAAPITLLVKVVLYACKKTSEWYATMSDGQRDDMLRAILAEKDPERSFDNVVQQRHENGFVWVPAPQATTNAAPTTTNDADLVPLPASDA